MVITEKPDIQLLYKGTVVTMHIDKKDAAGVVTTLAGLEPGIEYDVEIKKHKERRSLNANSYHWTLCEQMARALGTSKYAVHNQLMIDYGVDWVVDGKRTYVLMKDDDRYLSMETTHYRPTDATEDRKGTMYRWFILLLPSHLMDTAQMSALIEGTISECKEMGGIETRTPDEINRMIVLWEGGCHA